MFISLTTLAKGRDTAGTEVLVVSDIHVLDVVAEHVEALLLSGPVGGLVGGGLNKTHVVIMVDNRV